MQGLYGDSEAKSVAHGTQPLPPAKGTAIDNSCFTLKKDRKRRMTLESPALKELGNFHLDQELVRIQESGKVGKLSFPFVTSLRFNRGVPEINDVVMRKCFL